LVKRLADTPAKYLADILAKCLADRLPALKKTRDIIGLMVPFIAIAIFSKPAGSLDNIKSYNIPFIDKIDLYIDGIKLYSI
jgi:hypothetical protein